MSKARDQVANLRKDDTAIPLSALIDALRADLLESAQGRDPDWQPLFEISEATVEASVRFEKSEEAGGKISVWVMEFAPKAGEKSESAHKISIKLVPIASGSGGAPGTTVVAGTPGWRARGRGKGRK